MRRAYNGHNDQVDFDCEQTWTVVYNMLDTTWYVHVSLDQLHLSICNHDLNWISNEFKDIWHIHVIIESRQFVLLSQWCFEIARSRYMGYTWCCLVPEQMGPLPLRGDSAPVAFQGQARYIVGTYICMLYVMWTTPCLLYQIYTKYAPWLYTVYCTTFIAQSTPSLDIRA